MEFLRNLTIAGGIGIGNGSAGGNTFGFPSYSNQPTMPSDQRAKLLAMHRDGTANAGMYVAVVLLVYLILVIFLLCRYTRRRSVSEPPTNLDSTTERGRFYFQNWNCDQDTACRMPTCCFRKETSKPYSVNEDVVGQMNVVGQINDVAPANNGNVQQKRIEQEQAVADVAYWRQLYTSDGTSGENQNQRGGEDGNVGLNSEED